MNDADQAASPKSMLLAVKPQGRGDLTKSAVLWQVFRTIPDVPMVLLGKDANEGLAAARNTGFAEARAEFVMVMDADNTVYPTALARLAGSLRQQPDAAATYSVLRR